MRKGKKLKAPRYTSTASTHDYITIYNIIPNRQELYAYFKVLIYIGITIKSSIKDYWGDLKLFSIGYIVKNYISLIRF